VDTFLDLPSSAIATFALVPHLGLGLGLEQASDGHSGEATDLAVRTTIGATWPLPGFPHVALTADYRFTALPDTPYPSGGSRPSYDHALLFGAKIYFGGKRSVDDPKMMPPVSIQEPSRYLVFFDWDVDSLTTRSSQIVATAAISSRHAVATIEIKAYDDDHSTTEYERELARRRVVAVSSELVRDGVAANAIVVLSKDNDDTGPGVRIKIIARTN
jgi:hypothetical protein